MPGLVSPGSGGGELGVSIGLIESRIATGFGLIESIFNRKLQAGANGLAMKPRRGEAPVSDGGNDRLAPSCVGGADECDVGDVTVG